MTIKFSVPIEPRPAPRADSRGKQRYSPAWYRQWLSDFGWFARQAMAMHGLPPLSGAVKISVDIYRKRNPLTKSFGDGDNHLKAIMDALTGICYEDDAQVIVGTFNKFRGTPHIAIELEEL